MTVHGSGSQFTKNWLNQIAVGVGTGLRLDISILLLRLDLGIPVREPWLAPNSQWVFDTKQCGPEFCDRVSVLSVRHRPRRKADNVFCAFSFAPYATALLS